MTDSFDTLYQKLQELDKEVNYSPDAIEGIFEEQVQLIREADSDSMRRVVSLVLAWGKYKGFDDLATPECTGATEDAN
jgi:hypothetical protein